MGTHLVRFKMLERESVFPINFLWVERHAIEARGWANCTMIERLNDGYDRLAKTALIYAASSGSFIDPNFPFEQLRISTNKRVTGSIRAAIDRHWGHSTAKRFFNDTSIISTANFDLVWWDGVETATKSFPKLYRLWLTKQVTECCRSNLQMSYCDDDNDPLCPCCHSHIESIMHMT